MMVEDHELIEAAKKADGSRKRKIFLQTAGLGDAAQSGGDLCQRRPGDEWQQHVQTSNCAA